ncbi:MAG: prolyl oligopeptidase family serine peptidase [Candidatus Heimdallarchaeota archaeon]
MSEQNYLENLLKIPIIYSRKISSKKDKIAFSWKNVHENTDVFTIDLETKSEPIPVTKTLESTRTFDYYPKSNAILVGEDKSRNERIRLFRINLDEPLKMIPITEDDPKFFMRGGQIHPTEKWVFYDANFNPETNEEIEPTWIIKHNLESGERVAIAQPKKAAWIGSRLNKTGTHLIYQRKDYHPKGEQVWLVDIDGKDDKEILNFGEKARTFGSWLPDSERVAFITDTKDGVMQKHYSFGIYNIKTEETEWIIDDPKRNIERIYVPSIGNHIVVVEYVKARSKITIIEIETMKHITFPDIPGNLFPIGQLQNDEWIGIYSSSTQPDEFVKFNINSVKVENFEYLLDVWNKLSITKDDLVPAKDYDWKGKDGLPVHGWLYKPKNNNGKTIIFVHGGPTYHSSDEINHQIQYYTNQGFIVLDPNYRGSTGYGVAFEDSIKDKGWGADEQNDIIAGIEQLIADGLATKNKVGMTGTSYGGYSSWFAITKNPKELIAATAPICGMTDLVVDYETTRPDLRTYSEEMLGGSPTEVPEIYYDRSPVNFIDKIQGKILIIQGAQDPNVSPENIEAVKDLLKENNIEHKIWIFEDEGHGIHKTNNQKELYVGIAKFFTDAL